MSPYSPLYTDLSSSYTGSALCTAGGTSRLYRISLDQIHDDWNMAAIVSLLNFLDLKLVLIMVLGSCSITTVKINCECSVVRLREIVFLLC